MDNLDPQKWVQAVRLAVDTLPYGNTILLCLIIIGMVYFALVPLIKAWRGK